MNPLILMFIAGCGKGGEQVADVHEARMFSMVYQSNLAGEIEPCG